MMLTRERLIQAGLALLATAAFVTMGVPSAEAQLDFGSDEMGTAQKAPVYWLDDFDQVDGAEAKLVRRDSSIKYKFKTRSLTPGDTFTFWVCGWNNPSDCAHGPGTCGEVVEDFDIVDQFCWWGGGGVIHDNGKATISGRIKVGQPIGSVFFGEFTAARAAEINLVLRSHGPVIPGRRREQTSTFEGGCDVNLCEDLQVAIFPGE